MNETILQALIELIKTGGWFSIAGIFLWQLLVIVKITVIAVFTWLSIKVIANKVK